MAIAELDQKITALSGVVSPRIVLAGTEDGQILQVTFVAWVSGGVYPVASFVCESIGCKSGIVFVASEPSGSE